MECRRQQSGGFPDRPTRANGCSPAWDSCESSGTVLVFVDDDNVLDSNCFPSP
jgi:hypothetical protein